MVQPRKRLKGWHRSPVSRGRHTHTLSVRARVSASHPLSAWDPPRDRQTDATGARLTGPRPLQQEEEWMPLVLRGSRGLRVAHRSVSSG
eukprot:2296955-Prymnesium_polylepis.1